MTTLLLLHFLLYLKSGENLDPPPHPPPILWINAEGKKPFCVEMVAVAFHISCFDLRSFAYICHFVWCSCTQIKINACLTRSCLSLCSSCVICVHSM